MKEQAKQVLDVYFTYHHYKDTHLSLASALRETINQLQKGTPVGAVIMCEDVLELCEELEKL